MGKWNEELPLLCRASSEGRAAIGAERTLEKDVREKADIKLYLRRSADVIGRRLRQKRYTAFGVGVKLKTTDFQILTRQRRLNESTDVTYRLYLVGVDLLDEFNHPGPFRLVGMAAYDLIGIDDRVQLDGCSAYGKDAATIDGQLNFIAFELCNGFQAVGMPSNEQTRSRKPEKSSNLTCCGDWVATKLGNNEGPRVDQRQVARREAAIG